MTLKSTPPLFTTAHMVHFLNLPASGVYVYDPADDGPECEVITRILARHPLYVPSLEKQAIKVSRHLDAAALALYGKPFAKIGEDRRTIVRERVAQTLARKRVS
jgi:hypothetical protein